MSSTTALTGLGIIVPPAYQIVNRLRHPEEQPLAGYLIVMVVLSATTCSTFLGLVNLSLRWPEATAISFILSTNGVVLLSVVPSFLLEI